MSEQTVIPPAGSEPVLASPVYAGVLRRFVALLIDRLIVNVVLFILFVPLAFVTAVGVSVASPMAFPVAGVGTLGFWLLCLLADWIYFATLESSERGATLGKRLLGMRVTDEKGARLTFLRASVRYFGKILSALPMMLGFVLAFFTQKTQALHDLIAETVVVRVR